MNAKSEREKLQALIENSFYSYAELTEEQKVRFAAYQVFDMPKKASSKLEAAQARWVMASERLPKVSGWYLTGLVYFLGSPYSGEVYFDAENIEPRWNNITSDKIYCWLEGVPELPQPPEVQE